MDQKQELLKMARSILASQATSAKRANIITIPNGDSWRPPPWAPMFDSRTIDPDPGVGKVLWDTVASPFRMVTTPFTAAFGTQPYNGGAYRPSASGEAGASLVSTIGNVVQHPVDSFVHPLGEHGLLTSMGHGFRNTGRTFAHNFKMDAGNVMEDVGLGGMAGLGRPTAKSTLGYFRDSPIGVLPMMFRQNAVHDLQQAHLARLPW